MMIRPSWLILAAVCSALAPQTAFATVYDFTSTETSALGNPSYSFQLDTTKAVDMAGATTFANVAVYDSGVSKTGAITIMSGDGEISGPGFFFVDTDVPGPKPFAVGSGAEIVFNVGAFSIADGYTDGEGSLIISQSSGSAAPEPATWLLMIAGIGGVGLRLRQVGGAMRCRRSRAAPRQRAQA